MRDGSRRAALACALLDRIKATDDERPPTDQEIADVAGVSRSVISHWRDGSDPVEIWHLQALCRVWGAEVVMGATAPPCAGNPLRTVTAMVGQLHAVQGVVVEALADDGRFDAMESAALERALDQLDATSRELRGQVARRAER